MVKCIVLPGSEELTAKLKSVSDDADYLSDFYPGLVIKLAGKEFTPKEIDDIVTKDGITYSLVMGHEDLTNSKMDELVLAIIKVLIK